MVSKIKNAVCVVFILCLALMLGCEDKHSKCDGYPLESTAETNWDQYLAETNVSEQENVLGTEETGSVNQADLNDTTVNEDKNSSTVETSTADETTTTDEIINLEETNNAEMEENTEETTFDEEFDRSNETPTLPID